MPVVSLICHTCVTSKHLEHEMANNSSNDSSLPSEELSQSFLYFSSFTLVFFHLPLFTVNILLLVAIITEKTLPATVRLVLGNIVASSEVVIIGLFGLLFYYIILQPPSSPLAFICRLFFFIINSGSAGRLLYMATYAVTVYVLVRYAGTNLRVVKLRFWPTLLAIVFIWILAIVPNMVLLSSAFFEITFTTFLACTNHTMGATSIVYAFGYIILYGICCFILSIIFPTLTARYIKKYTISKDKQTLKNMMKFSAFLLLGNSINVAGTSFPLLLAAFTPVTVGEDFESLFILEVILFVLSLLTTPIILLVFFKGVRQRFKMIACFICLHVALKKTQRQLPRPDVR